MEASTAIQSRLIGAILVDKNLITAEQLQRALQLQADTGERLGEIVVAEFGVARLELASVLAEQWAELEKVEPDAAAAPDRPALTVEPLTPAEVHIRRPIGEIFVELGFISSDQLDAALDAQRETGARIGEILVEQGSLTRLDLASALAEQWSALQKLRPPEPAADPQPWQNGVPVVPPAAQEWSADDRAVVAALEERLRVVERAASATPWQEDLRLVTASLRSAVNSVEERLEARGAGPANAELVEALDALGARLETLESAASSAELESLRQGLEELSVRPVDVEGLAELRNQVERLEARPNPADVVAHLASEIATLAARLDEITDVTEVSARLDMVAGQAEGAHSGLEGLASRVDDLAGLQSRIDELAGRLPDDGAIHELERSLEELAARPANDGQEGSAAEIAALETRLDYLAARVEDVAATPVPDLTPRIDELAHRIEEVAGATPVAKPDELAARLDSLEESGRAGNGALERLASELDELGTRTQERLDALASREPENAPVEELRSQIVELAEALGHVPDTASLDEIRGRLEGLTAAVQREPDTARIDELRARFDELTVEVGSKLDTESLDEIRDRLDELAAAVQREPDTARVEQLRSQVDGLVVALERKPDSTALEAIRVRVEELAAGLGQESASAPLDDLRARMDELSAFMERAPDAALVDGLRSRMDELASAVERGPDLTPVNELRARVDDLADTVAQTSDTAPLDDIRARIDELAVSVEKAEVVGTLEARMDEIEHRLAAATPAEELRNEMRRVAESTVVERESLEQALYARVEEITSTIPREHELQELRSRLEEVAARPLQDRAMQVRVDDVSARLDDLGAVAGTIADLRESLEGLSEVRVADALATGARLAGLEAAVASIAGLEARIRDGDDLADRSRLLAARLDGTESRLVAVGELEESVSALAAELERKPDADALANAVAGLRTEIEALAARPTIADPSERLLELSQRIDRTARDGHDKIGALAEEMNLRLGGLAETLEHRVDDLAARADGFVGRDEAAATIAEQAAWIRSELEAVHAMADERATTVDASLADADRARAAAQQALGNRMDGAIGAIRAELDARDKALAAQLTNEIAGVKNELGEQKSALTERLHDAAEDLRTDLEARSTGLGDRLEEQWNETAALRAQIEALQESTVGRADWEKRIESILEQRLDGLAGRITDEVAGVRAEAESAAAALRGESASLGSRIDEMLALRHTDLRAARDASERLAERVEELAGLYADDADAARGAALDLSERLTSLAASLHAEAADARSAADRLAAQVGAQIGDLRGLREDDLAAVELVGAALAARLDDHALQSTAAAFEVEQALRDELGGIAARLEERDAQGIEAREELRGELERVASSVGWRLERIEESLSADDTVELKSAIAEVERRLEGQVALGEEQVRATERALRKGLASLGERLITSESAYVEAGNTFRRSIERLGAAVIEADARMADQIPVSDAEGCVAFAPTAAGYRLVELPGKAPEVGATVELEACDGPLVVTRYGRSPLPLDNRPCAYLDRT